MNTKEELVEEIKSTYLGLRHRMMEVENAISELPGYAEIRLVLNRNGFKIDRNSESTEELLSQLEASGCHRTDMIEDFHDYQSIMRNSGRMIHAVDQHAFEIALRDALKRTPEIHPAIESLTHASNHLVRANECVERCDEINNAVREDFAAYLDECIEMYNNALDMMHLLARDTQEMYVKIREYENMK